jgi:SSS family transporter
VWLTPVLILIPGFFVTAMVVFPLLRRMNITSTYEYLDRRFNRTLRLIASAQCILLQTFGRGSVVLLLPALAIAVVTGMNVYLCVILMGVLTTVYTTLGGFQAVIWTELFQGVLKFIAPLVMIGACILSLPGGIGEFVEVGRTYHKFDLALLTWDVTVPALWIIMLSGFFTATLVPAGDQPIIQRVFSSPTKEVRKVTAMSTFCGVTIGLISQTLGIAIFCYFRAHPDKFDPTAQNDQIVPLFVTQAMPVGFAGLIVAAIFASAMATVASGMNSVATIFTQDFYLPRKPDTSDHKRVVVMKLTSCLVGVLATGTALLLAALDLKSMMVVWNQIVALLGGGIVGVYSLGMFTRRANGFGAVGGALISVAITAAVKWFTPLHWSTYVPIAIVSCMVFGYLLSLLKPQRKDLSGLTIYTPAPHN